MDIWSRIVTFFTGINIFTSLIDIIVVAAVIYSLIKLVRDSRAEQLIKGLILIVVAYGLSLVLHLQTLTYLMGVLFDNALILVVVVFQPEIRRALEHFGHSSLSGAFAAFGRGSDSKTAFERQKAAITAVCGAVEQLQRQKMGALIVFERNTKLGEIIASGTVVDADPSVELVGNIFFNKAPLHDGAMIIRDGRVCAAGCILPLTTHHSLSSSLGTRHRAAVGMSENSDALVVVVSEETSAISLAQGGELTRDYTPKTLQIALEGGLLTEASEEDQRGIFRRLFKGKEDAQ
ncbi:MAG: TIGR00159 family protein [Ruminococcaceae bacterium]|nr:TIGR00159 family protein [Oscillospiraceae bacterium]